MTTEETETALSIWYLDRYHTNRATVTEILAHAEHLGLWKEEDFLWKVSRICTLFSHKGKFEAIVSPAAL